MLVRRNRLSSTGEFWLWVQFPSIPPFLFSDRFSKAVFSYIMEAMDASFLILSLVVVAGFGGIFYFLNKKLGGQPEQEDDKSLLMIQNQINDMRKTLDFRLDESAKIMQKHSFASSNTIKDVIKQLTEVQATNKLVLSSTDQLKSLQDVLKNPKQRGVLGEYYLETVLKNLFPANIYQMQYKFKDGKTVDAVIFQDKGKIIPIDSKFSLENYKRILESSSDSEREQYEKIFRQDIKNRIDETSKYIRPEEGTTDYAFMFIPAEGIYYDLLVNQVGSNKFSSRDLLEYAVRDKKVFIVSPNTFAAFLQTVLHNMRSQQLEKSTQQMIKKLQGLDKHLRVWDGFMKKLGSHLGTTVNSYNTAYKELGKIDKDIMKISGDSMGIQVKQLEKPEEQDTEEGTLL